MNNAYFYYPEPKNETVLNYGPNSPERKALRESIAQLKSKQIDIPMYIGSEKVFTNHKIQIHPPHETSHVLGCFNMGEEAHVHAAEGRRGVGGHRDPRNH